MVNLEYCVGVPGILIRGSHGHPVGTGSVLPLGTKLSGFGWGFLCRNYLGSSPKRVGKNERLESR